MWEKLDLNQRRDNPIDLQSTAFNHSAIFPFMCLVGVEPTTYGAEIRYSIQLSYKHVSLTGFEPVLMP